MNSTIRVDIINIILNEEKQASKENIKFEINHYQKLLSDAHKDMLTLCRKNGREKHRRFY